MINKKNDPRKAMKVPEGFFENFEENLMEEISTEAKIIPLWKSSKLSAIAAIFIVLIGVLFILKVNTNSNSVEFAELSVDQNWDYILEHSDHYTIEDFIDLEDSEATLQALEQEIYGSIANEEFINDIDLETIENLFE